MRDLGKYVLKGILAFFAAFPLKVHYFNARILCFVLKDLVGYRSEVVTVNLTRSFPDLSPAEIKKLKNKFYRHLADMMVEAIWFGGCNAKRLHKSHIVELKNPEYLDKLYRESPSVMVLYTHAGNWELLGGMESYDYTGCVKSWGQNDFTVVYLALSSRTWDEIMRDNRTAPVPDKKNFPGYIESRSIIRYAIDHRSEKKIYNVNTDQRPYFTGSDSITVNFMNQECKTMSAAASLARKFGMPVLYQRMEIVSRGHYSLEYVPICEDSSKMSVEEIMKRYYKLLEADIQAQPHNYIWSHKRWA